MTGAVISLVSSSMEYILHLTNMSILYQSATKTDGTGYATKVPNQTLLVSVWLVSQFRMTFNTLLEREQILNMAQEQNSF